jgi:hypothetical protein
MGINGVGVVAGIVGCAVLSACSPETSAEEIAPSALLDELSDLDQGTSYNGWTQSVTATYYAMCGTTWGRHRLTRSSGDATRGGGTCLTVRKASTTCSSDSTCVTAARAEYGPSAYGYCYSGICYSRPGGADNCVTSANRSSGTLDVIIDGANGVNRYFVGCMTKTAGPNPACGSTDSSSYMRTMSAVVIDSTTGECM